MWFDSHCHLDAHEFEQDLSLVVARAAEQGVTGILVPCVSVQSMDAVLKIIDTWSAFIPYLCFTLGIHPLYTGQAGKNDLKQLEQYLKIYQNHPRLVGIGEIGLDYFVKDLDPQLQEVFFEEQLGLAKDYSLPVILHVRKSQDQILKRLRQVKLSGGIAHAFNGSHVQAQNFLNLNFKLGFGGAMTYPRALQIQRLARDFPLSSYVLETDAPDISPAWLKDEQGKTQRNEPSEIPAIARYFSDLRQIPMETLEAIHWENLYAVLPRLRALKENYL
jgi:TatD DNase family protein